MTAPATTVQAPARALDAAPLLLALSLPAGAGVAMFGWRAAGVMLTCVAAAAWATAMWRLSGPRGRLLAWDETLVGGVLTALFLPAGLFTLQEGRWLAPLAAGALLAMLQWIAAPWPAARAATPLGAALLLMLAGAVTPPRSVLLPERLFVGDVLDAAAVDRGAGPWWGIRSAASADALRADAPTESLSRLLRSDDGDGDAWASLEGVVRDALPPLEDVVVGGYPAAIGCGSAVAILAGALLLLNRGLVRGEGLMLVPAGLLAAMLLLPAPVLMSESGPVFRWPLAHAVGWPMGLTYAHYHLLATPGLLASAFIWSRSDVLPRGRLAACAASAAGGGLIATLQLYVSPAHGAMIALLMASVVVAAARAAAPDGRPSAASL